MAWRDWGNIPINSTTAQPASNPSTSTLIAEVDSTQLGTVNFATGQHRPALVTWILGSDTNALWQCEVANSTALASPQDTIFLRTPPGASGQFVTTHSIPKDGRVRARLNSTFTGSASAYIAVEYMT
ncbi:MAG: hypothetical protein KA154_14770 [Gemmatimonadaceae bacterium]|nr:hypothetical protein [Gemmatimonadaceae bacterium]